jgi:hypothetical protein
LVDSIEEARLRSQGVIKETFPMVKSLGGVKHHAIVTRGSRCNTEHTSPEVKLSQSRIFISLVNISAVVLFSKHFLEAEEIFHI